MRLWSLALIMWVGCAGSEQSSLETFFLFGKAESIRVDADGAWFFVRLVPDQNQVGRPTYLTSCQLVNISCQFQINQVLEGVYDAYGLIDLNGNTDRFDPQGDRNDLVAPPKPLLMLSRQQLDFGDEVWLRYP